MVTQAAINGAIENKMNGIGIDPQLHRNNAPPPVIYDDLTEPYADDFPPLIAGSIKVRKMIRKALILKMMEVVCTSKRCGTQAVLS